MGEVRRALADEHPLHLLALVATVLDVLDPRRASPFDRARGERETQATREQVLQAFLEIDQRESSAILAVAAELGEDEVERRRITRELARRDHRLPTWMSDLTRAEAYRTVEMVHRLGDGDNVIVGVRLPSGHELSVVVYIDHNMGTLVKDAFVVPESVVDLIARMRAMVDDPDTTWSDIPGGDARARIVDAIEVGAMTYPPFETDTWPACRPIVEWAIGRLPEGGKGYERPEWSEDERRSLAARFLSSSHAVGLDDPDHADLLDSLLWFACDYGPGDPLRWSPVAVEIVLVDWIPRKIVADADHLSKAPAVLRSFVRFCHAERSVPAHLTDQTLDAIARWEPEYQAIIRTTRPQGAAALLSAIGVLDPEAAWPTSDDGLAALADHRARMLGSLERAVGGPAALAGLDDRPLPDEPFDWTGIPDDVHERVAEVLALTDGCCDELLDVEHRTATRRVLARIAGLKPEVFRRRGRPETAAAAICWSVGRVNHLFDSWRGGMTAKELLAHFGLEGSVSQRAGTLLAAGGFPSSPHDFTLGSPEYLVSSRRRDILATLERFST